MTEPTPDYLLPDPKGGVLLAARSSSGGKVRADADCADFSDGKIADTGFECGIGELSTLREEFENRVQNETGVC